MWFYAQECFHNKVLKLCVYILVVNALFLISLSQHLEVPFRTILTISIVIIFSLKAFCYLVLILDEVDILLVHREIS